MVLMLSLKSHHASVGTKVSGDVPEYYYWDAVTLAQLLVTMMSLNLAPRIIVDGKSV